MRRSGSLSIWSSVEYTLFMRGLVRELSLSGKVARRCFAISDSFYRSSRSRLERLWLRLRMYIEYPLRLAWYCFWKCGAHVQVVCTNTFYAPLVAYLFTWRSDQRVVHLVYDLFPDALIESGALKADSFAAKVLRKVVGITLRKCAANVFLGQRLLEHAERQFGPIPKAHIIPVGADAAPFRDNEPQLLSAEQPVRFLYCGNMGAMHDIDLLAAGLAQCARAALVGKLDVAIHSSGPRYKEFQEKLVRAQPHLPSWLHLEGGLKDDDWVQRMARAHVAIVTMRPGAEKVVMPSKTYSALAAGQAILAICPPESDLADLVREHDCGWVVSCAGGEAEVRSEKLEFRKESREDNGWHQEPTTNNQQPTTTFPQVIQDILSNPEELLRKRRNAFRAGQEVYDMKSVARMWENILQ